MRKLIPTDGCPNKEDTQPQTTLENALRLGKPADFATLRNCVAYFTALICLDDPHRWFSLVVRSPSVFGIYSAEDEPLFSLPQGEDPLTNLQLMQVRLRPRGGILVPCPLLATWVGACVLQGQAWGRACCESEYGGVRAARARGGRAGCDVRAGVLRGQVSERTRVRVLIARFCVCAVQLVSEMTKLKQTSKDNAALEQALQERIERVWATTEVVGRTDAIESLNRKRLR